MSAGTSTRRQIGGSISASVIFSWKTAVASRFAGVVGVAVPYLRVDAITG
jgi:hypothetical protein